MSNLASRAFSARTHITPLLFSCVAILSGCTSKSVATPVADESTGPAPVQASKAPNKSATSESVSAPVAAVQTVPTNEATAAKPETASSNGQAQPAATVLASAEDAQKAPSNDPPRVVVPEEFSAGPRSQRLSQLAQLDKMIGTWTGTVVDAQGQTHPITISRRWVMCGIYVLSEFQFHNGTKDVIAMDVTTFDPVLYVFRRWYFDRNGFKNSLADPMQFYGLFAKDVLHVDSIDPDTGHQVDYTQKFAGDDKEEWSITYLDDAGKKVDVYRGTNTRIDRDPMAAYRQRPDGDASPVLELPQGPTAEIPQLKMLNRMVGVWSGIFKEIPSGQDAPVRYATTWTMNGNMLLAQIHIHDFPQKAPPERRLQIFGMELTTYDSEAETFRRWHFDTDAREEIQLRYGILTGEWSDAPPTIRFKGYAFDGEFPAKYIHKYPEDGKEIWDATFLLPNWKYTNVLNCTLTRDAPSR